MDTYIQPPLISHLVQITGHYGWVVHWLDTLVITESLPQPIGDSYVEEVVQDIVIKIVGVPSVQFLTDTTYLSPQTIIKMTLLKDIIPPETFIKMLLTQKDHPIAHMSGDLGDVCQWDSHNLTIHDPTPKSDG